jgi:hypothetical protein
MDANSNRGKHKVRAHLAQTMVAMDILNATKADALSQLQLDATSRDKAAAKLELEELKQHLIGNKFQTDIADDGKLNEYTVCDVIFDDDLEKHMTIFALSTLAKPTTMDKESATASEVSDWVDASKAN